MRNIININIIIAAASLLFPAIASASDLGFRLIDSTGHTDHECEVETIDDLTCELACDGPDSDAFSCLCDENVCECVDSSMTEFVMLPDPDEGAWCDQLRRGGGHYNNKPCKPGGDWLEKIICEISKAPPPSPSCTPCLYGCTDNVCD